MKIETVTYENNIPCLWERGGSYSNTGEATIITSPEGSPKRALRIPREGHLACGKHALVPIVVGDIVIVAEHHRREISIEISQITGIPQNGGEITAVKIGGVSKGKTESFPLIDGLNPVEYYRVAVEAATDKAMDYHCRAVYYAE